MSLTVFVPASTHKARSTALSAFNRMLEEERVSLDFVHASIGLDSSGKRLATIMDRFGFYLATKEEAILLKQAKTLEKHCLKRENGGMINKAPPCTKGDLRALVHYLYSTERVGMDYQDAALVCLMWHCFGRSSDLGYVHKQHFSVSVFYLRLLRVETAEEQSLTLVLDKKDFLTCPLLTMAVALAMQKAPCPQLLDQLPALAPQLVEALDPGTPLHDLLAADPARLQVAVLLCQLAVKARWSAKLQFASPHKHPIQYSNNIFAKATAHAGCQRITGPNYKGDVLCVGQQAEASLLADLQMRRTKVKGARSVLRALRPLHKSGAPDSQIVTYKHLLSVGLIQDPAPVDT
ncbi:hypothetical protein PHMEG_00028259 [Phytophthora megakarya]|uniref:Uncharacterized protein n=1 Tax=Phytophthora megakarya TaxID=4795 RepID=A0A225V6Z0_9STRA|nr:hypothetical protein PHMEG_00028259 [Phytophthora megakarya]